MPDFSGGCGCVVRIVEARPRPLTFHAIAANAATPINQY
jgi:hypothetical protein